MHWSEFDGKLQTYLSSSPLMRGLPGTWPSSRWQKATARGPATWIKRDDELSFSISGCKYRKLLSITAAIQERGLAPIVAWGSSRSQFLLGLLQLARELGISCELFLLRSTPWQEGGIDQIFQLWQPPAGLLHWVERSDWPQVRALAEARAAELGERVLLLAEGGAEELALPGALTLALDIVAQEEKLDLKLASIWIDAGTGFTAQALLVGLAWLERLPLVEIVLCAGDPGSFEQGLKTQLLASAKLFGKNSPELPPYRLHRPPTAASFGSTNAAVWQEIRRAAQEEGLLLDPIYTAKLSLTERLYPSLESRLMVHSGGGLSLFGYKF